VVRPPRAGRPVRCTHPAAVLHAPRKHQAAAGGDRGTDRGEDVAPFARKEIPMVMASGRIIASVAVLASFSSSASADNCSGLRSWARFYCLAQSDPQKYVRCNE